MKDMTDRFQFGKVFILKKEKEDGIPTYNMSSVKLMRFLDKDIPNSTIVFKEDVQYIFERINFKTVLLSFDTDYNISFVNCTFDKDVIIRNEGIGRIDINGATFGSENEPVGGKIVSIYNDGNITIDGANSSNEITSVVSLKSESTIFLDNIDTNHEISVMTNILQVGNCDNEIVIKRARRVILDNSILEDVPKRIGRKTNQKKLPN